MSPSGYYKLLVLVTSVLTLSLPFSAQGQHPTDPHDHRVMARVDAAFDKGQISLDQKVLYKFYAGLKPEKLPSEFRAEDIKFIKCGTPAQIDYRHYKNRLSPSTINEIESLVSAIGTSSAATYLSPSGKFELHYETSGSDAVPLDDNDNDGIPDYVEWTAAAADSSWRHEVERLGYSDPILTGNPYDIYFRSFGFYGQTVSTSNTTYIEVHNDFENFPPNTDPQGNVRGAIKATMAHELKHAIQFANSEWYESPLGSQSPHSFNWTEMDATLMEEVVYDNVNDYYNYLFSGNSIFLSPEDGIPGAYWQVSWFIFFEEKYGSSFWVNVWSRIKERYEQGNPDNYLGMREAISMTLENDFGTTLESAFIESHLWHLASGPINSPPVYGFEERTEYPDPAIQQNLTGKDSTSTFTLSGFAANYLQLSPGTENEGFIRVNLTHNRNTTGFGLIAYFNDGGTDFEVLAGGAASNISYQTPWEWSEVNRIGIVVGNAGSVQEESYKITITSDIPEQFSLSQNYPNPFNPGTVIPFTLSEQSRVQIKIYDVTGRMVATILDEERPAGFYRDVQFNAGNLASGLYFYQLITDQRVLSRKMMLIK